MPDKQLMDRIVVYQFSERIKSELIIASKMIEEFFALRGDEMGGGA